MSKEKKQVVSMAISKRSLDYIISKSDELGISRSLLVEIAVAQYAQSLEANSGKVSNIELLTLPVSHGIKPDDKTMYEKETVGKLDKKKAKELVRNVLVTQGVITPEEEKQMIDDDIFAYGKDFAETI